MHSHRIIVSLCTATFMASMVYGYAQEQLQTEQLPDQWQYTSIYDQTSPISDNWWKCFNDPTLDSLISRGVDNNYNVLMAERRIEMARQALNQARSGYFPTLGLNAWWTKARNSGMTTDPTTPASKISHFDLGVNMNWQIDVFGKVTARAKESKAAFQATRAEYDAMMVTIAAKIASTYFQIRTVQSEIEVTNRHIASQKRIVEITEAREEAGLASKLDVTQARTTYYSTLATITSLKTAETTAINALAVLLGTMPEEIQGWISKPQPLPDYRQLVAVGIPAEILRRRPDIAEAEYTLAQYAAALGVAKKDFLPTLTFSGSIGTSAHKIDNLMKNPSFSYSIAPTLSWTIFDGLSRKAAVESAKEQMKAGIDNYNLTVITAVQEVETALATYSYDTEYIDYLYKVVENAHESLKLSIDLYKQGLTTFINVTNSQITLLQYANELVSAQGQALTDLVTLYEALGGGWQ